LRAIFTAPSPNPGSAHHTVHSYGLLLAAPSLALINAISRTVSWCCFRLPLGGLLISQHREPKLNSRRRSSPHRCHGAGTFHFSGAT
jgi:hypothetical protein